MDAVNPATAAKATCEDQPAATQLLHHKQKKQKKLDLIFYWVVLREVRTRST
jgi:hypothetical protein